MRPIPRLAPLALLVFSACVSVNATRLGPVRQYAPVHPDSVFVYQQEMDIEGHFDRVAVIYVEGDANTTNQRQMINAARKKAGRLGANAIILGRSRDPSAVTQIVAAVLDVSVQRRAEYLAVHVNAPEQR
jgi:hypothetical protein